MAKEKPRAPQTATFSIRLGDKQLLREATPPYGAFIQRVRSARNYSDLNHIIGTDGLTMKAVKPLLDFLALPTDKNAVLMGISSRTLSRWDADAPIGVMASRKLVEVDRLAKKGIDIFGNTSAFRAWLAQPNYVLGNVSPLDLLVAPFGIELIEDSLDALEFGNVM